MWERQIFETILLNLVTDLIPADHGAVVLADQIGNKPAGVNSNLWNALCASRWPCLWTSRVDTRRLRLPLAGSRPGGGGAGGRCDARADLSVQWTSSAPFDEGQLELLVAIAVTAAAAMEYRRTFEWLQQEKPGVAGADRNHAQHGWRYPAMLAPVQSDRSGIGDRQHRADPGREREREGIGVRVRFT